MEFFGVGVVQLIDIVLTAVPIYAILVSLRRARSSLVLGGILISGVCYLAARLLGFQLLALLLQGFFAMILVAVLVMFQEEIRQFFEGVALHFVPGRRASRRATKQIRPDVEALVRAVNDLARQRIGALIVLAGKSSLSRHLSGGVPLDGELSVGLLASLFDPHSMGHDGAVVVEGGRVSAFSCRLPLSTSITPDLQERGTRHAAALGLVERTDAICLVVSEERGTNSLARNGALTPVVDSAVLAEVLWVFLDSIDPNTAPPAGPWRDGLALRFAAVFLSVAMWFFLIHESTIEYHTYRSAVRTTGTPTGLAVQSLGAR